MLKAPAETGCALLEVFVELVTRHVLVEAGANLEAVACVNKSLASTVRHARDTYRRLSNSVHVYPDPDPNNLYRYNDWNQRVRREHEACMKDVNSLEDGLPQHFEQECWDLHLKECLDHIHELNDEYYGSVLGESDFEHRSDDEYSA